MSTRSSDNRIDDEMLRSLKERAKVSTQFGKELSSSARAVGPVEGMTRTETKADVASKLKKTGVALIALPDPVTGVVGVPLLAAGFAIEKLGKRELSLPEVVSELAKTVKELERLRRAALR